MDTILIALTYLVAKPGAPGLLAKPSSRAVYPLRHRILPLLGAVAVGFPRYELIKPGQPSPFDKSPYAALGVVAALIWADIVTSRDKTVGDRVGARVVDEER